LSTLLVAPDHHDDIGENTMRHTLKAVFDHRSDAQHVLDALLASGYRSTDMALSRAPPTLGTSVKRTFTRLFHWHPQAMDHFGRFIRWGHVVTFTTGSELESKSAVCIMERFGPVGIEDSCDESDHVSAPDVVSTGSPRNVTMSSIYPPGTVPEALQSTPDARSSRGSDSHDNDMEAYRYGNAMRTNDEYRYCSWDEVELWLKQEWEARAPIAATWDESMCAIRRGWNSTSPDIADDRYFRAHWNAIYRNTARKPDYDNRTPAYLYGSETRRSEKYRSHDWRDVEPDIEADWKARHLGQRSSWGDFKDAVKHGWNRVSLDMDGQDTTHQSPPPGGAVRDGIEDDDCAAGPRS
jgi:hypothetical protein